jgi:hypothetical protein
MFACRATANIITLATLFLILIAVNAAYTQDLQDTTCFPKCRAGFVCHQGTCVSKCNPQCGVGFRCTESGECVAVASPNQEKKENGFVASPDKLDQGFVIKCNRPGSEIYLDDSLLGTCVDTAYVNVIPDHKHTIEIIQKGYLPYGAKKKINSRERINVDVNLKKYTFDVSFQYGMGIPYSFANKTGSSVSHIQGDMGMRFPAGFFGINVVYAAPVQYVATALPIPLGFGISYRYIDVKTGVFSFEPGVKIGYFPYQWSESIDTYNQSIKRVEQGYSFIEPRLRFAWGGKTCQFVYEPSVGIGTIISLNLVSIGLNIAL